MGNAVRVLGPLRIVDEEGVAVDPGGKRQRRLLAALAVNCGDVVSIDSLVDIVFEGHPTEAADRTLQSYVSRLRRSLEGDDGSTNGNGRHIERVAPGYVLTLDPAEIDATLFEQLLGEAQTSAQAGDHARAVALYDEAMRLFRGQPFAEFADEEWAMAEANRLAELHATAIEDRAESQLALGGHAEVIGDLERFTLDKTIRERPRRQLMLALYRSGRQAEALRVYNDYFEMLSEEIGLEPSTEIRELEQRIITNDPSLDLTALGGESLRGYQLYEELGRGQFSTVFRGTQPSVGRDVAVKMIRAELANDPDFIRRFETEAHLIATLEHPYIVPLYDFWREPDAAYLVMRWLRGGTLAERIAERPLSLDECFTLMSQVGEALDLAHQLGIIHRDVKPANVFLDDSGNYFLGDFGIAIAALQPEESRPPMDSRWLPYASPEQILDQRVGAEADTYSVGVMLYEALTGHRPFAATSDQQLIDLQLHQPLPLVLSQRDDVPAAVDEVIQRATAKSPMGRYPQIGQLVAAFGEAIGATGWTQSPKGLAPSEVGPNPYKGLRAFGESDAADFFGRDRLTSQLVEQLGRPDHEDRLVTVVGPSGSGKSSLVRAGLIPALREGWLPGSEDWFVVTMMPGRDPFAELESALLRIAVNPPDSLLESLTSGPAGIGKTVKRVLPQEQSELVLVVDQFEELYTMVDDPAYAEAFITSLLEAVHDPHSSTRVVLTLRADYYDRPLSDPIVAEAVLASTVGIPPLASDELAAAIEKPALRVGAQFEDGLVARIASDLTEQPGALPLLQYTLAELYDRSSGMPTHEAYEAIGGVDQAISSRAEEIYVGLGLDGQEGARLLFSRLVTLGDGAEDTRRRVRMGELHSGPGGQAAIDAYESSRLLAFDHDAETREPTVEVAHEALIREWPRLRSWIEDDRDGLRIHRHLTESADSWGARGQDDADLYRGSRLAGSLAWSQRHDADLNDQERSFLDASQTRAEAEGTRTRRQNRRLRIALVGAAVVAAIALVASLVALREQRDADDARAAAETERDAAAVAQVDADTQRDTAQEQRALAESGQAGLQAAALREESLRVQGSDPRLATLLALEAQSLDPGPRSLDALGGALLTSTDWMGTLPGRWVEYSEFGPWLVSWEGTDIVLRSPDNPNEIVRTIPFDTRPNGPFTGISPEGDRLVQVVDERVRVIDLASGEVGPPDAAPEALHPDERRALTWLLAWTADGQHVLVNDRPIAVYAVDGINVELVNTIAVPGISDGIPLPIDTHPTEPLVAVGVGTALEIWDTSNVGTTRPRVVERYEGSQPTLLNWADDGAIYISTTNFDEAPLKLSDLDDEPRELPVGPGFLAAPLSDGSLFVSTNTESRVADAETGATLAGPWPTARGAGLVPVELDGGNTLIITGTADPLADLGVNLWSRAGGNTLGETLPPIPGPPDEMYAEFYPDVDVAAVGWDREHPTSLWDVSGPTAREITLSDAPPDPYYVVSPTTDGSVVAALAPGGTAVTVHELPSGRRLAGPYDIKPAGGRENSSANVDADRSTIYLLDNDPQRVVAYAFDSGERLGETASGGTGGWWNVLRNNVGNGFMVGLGGTQVYDLETLDHLGNAIPTAGTQAMPSESGRYLTQPSSGSIVITDLESRAEIARLSGAGGLAGYLESTDRYVIGWGSHHSESTGIRFWDVESLQALGPLVPGVAGDLSKGGAVTQVRAGRVHVWNIDPTTWPAVGCEAVGSNLTQEEWETLVPGDRDYEATCPQFPPGS